MNEYPKNGNQYRKLKTFLIDINLDLFLISEKMKNIDSYSDYDEIEYFVMALEDRRYLNHGGIDVRSIARETIKMFCRKKHGGASTIDMQMVRTITGFKDKTIFRKIYEATLAIIVNYKYTKKQIIRCYLANAYFGTKVTGLAQATMGVFDKQQIQLNNNEKAFIAAMLLRPKPFYYNEKWYELAMSRATYAQRVRLLVKDSN